MVSNTPGTPDRPDTTTILGTREWTLPHNLRNPVYVPPVVGQRIVDDETFWKMAVQNCKLNLMNLSIETGKETDYLDYATARLKAAQTRQSHAERAAHGGASAHG